MFSGDIHEELTATNEKELMPVFVDLFGVLIWCIKALANKARQVCPHRLHRGPGTRGYPCTRQGDRSQPAAPLSSPQDLAAVEADQGAIAVAIQQGY